MFMIVHSHSHIADRATDGGEEVVCQGQVEEEDVRNGMLSGPHSNGLERMTGDVPGRIVTCWIYISIPISTLCDT